MKKIFVRRLGVASVARFVGMANAIIGLVIGVFATFGGLAGVLEQSGWNFFTKIGASLGVVVVTLVIVPFLAFLWGWLYGAIVALVANLFLHSANGIELDIQDEAQHKADPLGTGSTDTKLIA